MATVKKEISNLLKRLPKDCSLEDVQYHLYVMQAGGDNQRRLTGSGGDDTKPNWSPRLD